MTDTTFYVAKLAPLEEDIIVRGTHGTTREHFDRCCFALDRTKPEQVPVLLDHKAHREVGHLVQLVNSKGWLEGVFKLDAQRSWSGVAEDVLRVGCPVSIGWEVLNEADYKRDGFKRMIVGKLHELSVITRGIGAIKGAEVTMVMKPSAARATPNPAPAPARAAPQPVVYRKPSVSARDQAEEAEMRRRLDWLEKHTGRYDLEAVLIGMQRELNGPSLDELLRQQRAA